MPKTPVLAASLIIILGQAALAADATIYQEDFEDFAIADDGLLGNGGWFGTGSGNGIHGIDDVTEVFGNSAFLGYFPDTASIPATRTTSVFRPVLFDAVAEGTPEVTISAIVGLQDSTNGEGDNFYFSILNAGGKLIAAVNFDNSGETPTFFRYDGVDSFATGATFFYDEAVEFFAEINFEQNRWSAFFGEVPVFLDAPFSSTLEEYNLGALGFEFEIFNTAPFRPGNNWMFFDEIEVTATGAPAFESPKVEPAGLSYFSEPAFSYQVEYSDDLLTWRSDLEGTAKPAQEPAGMVKFEDPSPPVDGRYYRVRRTPAE